MEFVAAASFPVVFFDGEREIDLGNAEIYPSLEFKKLQSMMSQRIGISPHQISISLIRRKVSRSSSDKRRRLPVTDKTDFAAILKEEDCFFYIKRLKKERRGKLRQSLADNDYLSRPIEIRPEKMVHPEKILRRDPGTKPPQFGLVSPYYNQIAPSEFLYRGESLGFGLVDYQNQFQNLQAQREKYLMSTANTYAYTDWEDGYVFERSNERNQAVSNIVCHVCSAANGRPTPFHWCVYDAVTVGFRSPAGPVARPTKDCRENRNRRRRGYGIPSPHLGITVEAKADGVPVIEEKAAPPPTTTMKKKRNLPGMPDLDAEVIALSPKTLMATNWFVCEICNKGFQYQLLKLKFLQNMNPFRPTTHNDRMKRSRPGT